MGNQMLDIDCIEICAGSVQAALSAASGGARRIEFCTNLDLGGTTPSYGQIQRVKSIQDLEVFVLIRPRGGHFVYRESEIQTMISDIQLCREIGVDGIVTGALTTDNQIDLKQCRRFKEAANPLPIVFHRAIDEIDDPLIAIDQLIDLGYSRILTSGGRETAWDGRERIKEMVEYSHDRIVIMAGSGINAGNLANIIKYTGVKEVHTSASEIINAPVPLWEGLFWTKEMILKETSAAKVAELTNMLPAKNKKRPDQV